MKRITILCISLLLITLFLTSCRSDPKYTPTGEFYVKTSPANGDAGVQNVISLEADHKTYEGDGDITVSMTVGLGHLPDAGGYGDDVQDTFYVLYRIIEAPWEAGKEAVWEKKVEYADSWYDSKYDSTEQKNSTILFVIPHYGEFYPLYKESVEFVFPASVEKGYLQVEVYAVIEGSDDQQCAGLEFNFDRIDGVLRLDPK